jgi:hypothetical protein
MSPYPKKKVGICCDQSPLRLTPSNNEICKFWAKCEGFREPMKKVLGLENVFIIQYMNYYWSF